MERPSERAWQPTSPCAWTTSATLRVSYGPRRARPPRSTPTRCLSASKSLSAWWANVTGFRGVADLTIDVNANISLARGVVITGNWLAQWPGAIGSFGGWLSASAITYPLGVVIIAVVTFLLVVLAAGTSLPNLFASTIVARKGQGDMAIANAFGSNIFNINIALGLPWLCAAIVYHEPWSVAPKQTPGHPIRKSSLAFNTVLLIAFILFFIITIAFTKLKLNRLTGIIFLLSYLLYLAYAILSDYYPRFQPDL